MHMYDKKAALVIDLKQLLISEMLLTGCTIPLVPKISR